MNLETIKSYIENKIEENLKLDYKASDSLQRNDKKTNEISKDVSAFANSDGGIIIYGIKENQVDRHLPEGIDPINRKEITKEWLEQIIQSKIQPRIDGIIIHSISIKEDSDDVIYVVEIPKSNTAHQSNDKKYYKRFNFNSEPMFDYEVRDVLNRAKFPIISLEFQITKNTHEVQINKKFEKNLVESLISQQSIETEQKTTYSLDIWARNEGKILANYLNAYVKIDKDILNENSKFTSDTVEIYLENTIRDLMESKFNGVYLEQKFGPSRYVPILPTRCIHLKEIEINELFLNSNKTIEWTVFSDNSEPKNGKIYISEIKIVEK